MTVVRIQRGVPPAGIPAPASLRAWAGAAFAGARRGAARSMTLRIVGEAEGRALNARYRGKPKATNVLSFPYPELAAELGDVVICAPVVRREAVQQGKPLRAHWAHMVVHGVLHLLGYDHLRAADARAMESREREILARFAFADPYAVPTE